MSDTTTTTGTTQTTTTGTVTATPDNQQGVADGATQAQTTSQASTTQPAGESVRMYDEKSYNDFGLKQFNAGLMKAMKDAGFTPGSEKDFKAALVAFKAHQESQKTEAEKQATALQTARQERDAAVAAAQEYERAEAVRAAGVDAQFAGYVAFEVGKLVTDTADFRTALATYLKANAERFNKAPDTRSVQVTTDPPKADATTDDFDFGFTGVRPMDKKQ
ncbi:MAG: hypothetical protein FWE08_03795 [Oscillospiraceae bacterium]|nr:hypothetical protein [Oscillospiraceae bacterium]